MRVGANFIQQGCLGSRKELEFYHPHPLKQDYPYYQPYSNE
jgi:hypothetical protein